MTRVSRYDHCSSTFHVGAGHRSWILIPDSLCDSLTHSPTVASRLSFQTPFQCPTICPPIPVSTDQRIVTPFPRLQMADPLHDRIFHVPTHALTSSLVKNSKFSLKSLFGWTYTKLRVSRTPSRLRALSTSGTW